MAADPRLRTWVTLVERSGLMPDFRGTTPFTVFASMEPAFDRYPQERQRLLEKSSGAFADICDVVLFVRSHVLLGLHPIAQLRGREQSLKSVVGTPMDVIDSQPLTMSWVSPGGKKRPQLWDLTR